MNQYNRITTVAAVTFFASIAFAVPPNSYLVKTVNTVGELKAQIRSNSVVSDRYQRHFHMTEGEVLDFVSNLRLAKVQQTSIYSIYGVPPKTGVLRSRLQKLKAGTKIWVDSTGQPILQWICGNPMTRGPRMVAVNTEPGAAVEGKDTDLLASPMPAGDAPIIASNIEPGVPQPEEIISIIDVPPATPHRNNYGGLLLLPLIALIPRGSGGEDIPPVPEPATMLVMGAGVVAVAMRRKRSK